MDLVEDVTRELATKLDDAPPNPHDHLPKLLTAEQLAEVYKLPRNSMAQVDLVISYMDTDQAINGELRQLAYELFERTPPPDDLLHSKSV